MVDRIRYPTVSYLPFYYVFFQFLLLTIFNLQANILTTKDILSNLGSYNPELLIKVMESNEQDPVPQQLPCFITPFPSINDIGLFQ